jgi:hypothetical protein
MGDRSITDRRCPDVREGLLTGVVVPSFGLAFACLLLLPGCLAFRLQEDNPATFDKSSNQSVVGRSNDDALLTSSDSNSKHQAELARLLAIELCDANPEETAQWARDVRNLDPAQAKIALQRRREMLNRKAALVKQQSFQQVCLTIPDEPLANRFAELPSELVASPTEIRQTAAWTTSSTPTFGHSIGQPTPSTVSIRTVSDRQQVDLRRVGLPFAGRYPSNEDVSGPALPLLPTGPPELQPPVDNAPSSSLSIEQPTETNPFETDDPKIAPGTPDPARDVQRGGIRDRFSKWGARFGFGNDEPEELSAPPQSVSPDSPDLQALDQQPVTSLQTLILLREDELRELGVVPPNDDQKRQDFIRQHVELRLLYLMNGQQSRALDAIPGISSSEQEFWQQVLWGLSDYFDLEGTASRTERISQTVKQFETAVNRLKEEARLSIRNLNFCRKISSYGNYEPFRRDDFTAGQPVLVYSEVENFKSVPVADGRYRTLLKSRIEIFRGDVRGQMVDSISFKPTEDLCRNPRRDYFHSYELTIPQDIGLGPHVLRLTIEDQLTGKQSTQTVNFMVK